MKKFIALLITAVLMVSVMDVTTAYAASVSVSFSGPYMQEVLAGKTYTIRYTLKASSVTVANANVSVGGAFEKVSGGENLWFESTKFPKAASGSVKGSIKVRVKSGAAIGSKGTISLSGDYNYLDSNHVETKRKYSKSYTVTVVDELTPRPVKEVQPTQWELAQGNIALMDQGGEISLDITESAKVPAAVLDDISKKQAVVNINFANYSCRIDGSSFSVPSGLKELDLSLSMEKSEALSAAAGGADAYQLHFGHSGQLPGPVTFRIKAESHSPGDTLYLYYYYDQSGKIEGKFSAVVDENGYVEFTILQCSSYFLSESIIEGALGSLSAVADSADKDAQILELKATISELEAQLEEAHAQPELAQDNNPEQTPPPVTKTQAAGELDISIIEFGAIVLGALLLGIIGTLIITRPGRKGRHTADRDSVDL